MKYLYLFSTILLGACFLPGASAEERTLTPEQMAEIMEDGALTEDSEDRPSNLMNFIEGDQPSKDTVIWTLGPTGIVGVMNDKKKGDQFMVRGTLKGSPADGKFVRGDVIVGLNGQAFKPTHLGILIGNAIMEAEKEENGGNISFLVWRDKNYLARTGKQDVTSVDIDKFFDEARDDNSVYDWKPEDERTEEVKQLGYDRFPADPVNLEISLKLRVLPDYADSAPYDCPKTEQILEEAWKVLEKKFVVDPNIPRSGRGGIIEAMALVSSGKPEHRELVREWVRGPHCPWGPPKDPPGTMFEPGYRGYKGFQSWHHGYNGLYCALYYEATGDEYVLPALRKYAIDTAMGQSANGSWGHTFAYPSFNGGELHKMNPGYGALNAAGNRCFFLIVLAQKLGIEHPEIDKAVERGHRFFSSYVDQGCIPYGDHGAYGSDDSNGKNTGIAFGMKLLGDNYGAKYFAMMSSHCAFTRRGGHGHDYHGNWSSWAATLCGPEVRAYNERNLRWRRTLCRMYDGSFVYHSPTKQSYGTLRDPTATEVFHQSVIYKQTLITGKDADEQLYPSEREMGQLLTSAAGQYNDPWLIEKAGKPWWERSTEEIIDLLDIFYPKARANFAKELGKRFAAGETDIVKPLVELLSSDQPRFRDGAVRALGECGEDAVLSNLSKIIPLLTDEKDFVRISAIRVVSKFTDDEEAQLAMLKATVDEVDAVEPNSVGNTTQSALFAKDTTLANDPFNAGFDDDLVKNALERVILLDPAGKTFLSTRADKWNKETVVRIAGPLTYAAEEEQVGDQMFANRAGPAQDVLNKFGYGEGILATAHRLRKKAAIRRDIRPFVGFKRTLMDPEVVDQNPAAFVGLIDEMETVLLDNPIQQLQMLVDDKKVSVPLEPYYRKIKEQKKAADMPSIAVDAKKQFFAELDALDGTGAKMKLCRQTLEDPNRKNMFRKIAAMEFLGDVMGVDAIEDLLPYIGHENWRLQENSREVVSKLIAQGGGDQLVTAFSQVSETPTKAAILEVLASSGEKSYLPAIKEGLKNESPVVRAAAVRSLASLEGEGAITDIVAHLKTAKDMEELVGCEEALLSYLADPTAIGKVRDEVILLLPNVEVETRNSICFILAKIGDKPSIDALRGALETDDFNEFNDIIFALSYSPSREADQVMLEMAAIDKRTAELVGEHSLRRMVVGPKGYGDITSEEKLDFAEKMLKMALDRRLIQYVGQIYEARALRILMYCLENGVESAAESMIACAEGMEDLSPKDAKIAAQSLEDVIEYIEVTRLRGGVQAHMSKDDRYPYWKALQARAGKVLLKVHKPEEAPIPEFDSLDLDL